MVNIGIIGLGRAWDSRYLPALKKLKDRARIRAVYDPIASRAEHVAAEIGAFPATGMLEMARRCDLRALLLLDPAWHGMHAVRLLCSSRKPLYLAGPLNDDALSLQQLQRLVVADSLTIMPELPHRYTPASSRLQELMATRLGRPRRIDIEAIVAAEVEAGQSCPPFVENEHLIRLFDWCRYIVRRAPESVYAQTTDHRTGQQCVIHVEFQPPKSGGESTVAELRLLEGKPPANAPETHCGLSWESLTWRVECERGGAVFSTADRISWHAESHSVDETLTSERSDVEVMLDQFCRRVVGGLIPVADINDLCRGMRLVHAAEQSRRIGRPVSLNGEPQGRA